MKSSITFDFPSSNRFLLSITASHLDSCQLIRLPCMPGGKLSPPLPPKKVMICMPPVDSLSSSSSSVSPSPLGYPQKCPPPKGLPSHHHHHHPAAALLASQLAGLSSLHHQSHGHPLQLQYGSVHRPSRIIEELNKTLALSMQRFERSVEPCGCCCCLFGPPPTPISHSHASTVGRLFYLTRQVVEDKFILTMAAFSSSGRRRLREKGPKYKMVKDTKTQKKRTSVKNVKNKHRHEIT